MPKRPDRKRFGELKKYVFFLKNNFPKRRSLFVGNFYTFFYVFDRSKKFDIIKFYDLMPLIFLFDRVEGKKYLFRGINFHHLPISVRLRYLGLMKELTTEDFNNDRRLIRLSNYEKLFRMFRKATKFSVRTYDVRNLRELRKIENSQLENALLFYSRTHYGVSISDIERKYLMFRV